MMKKMLHMTCTMALGAILFMSPFNIGAVDITDSKGSSSNNGSIAQQQPQQTQRDAALRLIRMSLSAPNADPIQILYDAKALFPAVFHQDELLQLVMDESKAPIPSTVLMSVPLTASGSIPDVLANTVVADTATTDTVASPASTFKTASSQEYDLSRYADRHVHRINAARHDYDCMEREFDLSDPHFKASDVAKVFHKCRLVVLRNVWPKHIILDYKIKLSNYISNLHEGVIDANRGKTTTGDNERLYVRRNKKRFDILIPVYLRVKEIIANTIIRKILKHSQVLGSDFIVNTVGCVIAESGAPSGSYHYDDEYILGTNSFQKYKLAGTDLPPVALSMFIPMLNATLQHGPTEFCMGTQHFKGLSSDAPVLNASIVANDTDFYKIAAFEEDKEIDTGCPIDHRRIPTANLGDAILFDYTITHRGGPNTSPDLRAMQYVMYSRDWFRDGNFDAADYDDDYDESANEILSVEEELTRLTRFALVEERHDCTTPPCPERIPLESIQNFLKPSIKQKKKETKSKKKKEQIRNMMMMMNSQQETKNTMTANFQVTNHDMRHGAFLWVGKTQRVADVALGESITLTLPIGATLELWDLDDELLQTWTIQQNQPALLLSHDEFYNDQHDHEHSGVPAPAQVRTILRIATTNTNMEQPAHAITHEEDEEEDEDDNEDEEGEEDDDDAVESNNETAEEL